MTKKQEEGVDQEDQTQEITAESDAREGNDLAVLVGSGAPLVKVRANVVLGDLRPGQVGTFIRTEELRMQVQQGLASFVEG